MKIKFDKYHGCGNDFIIINNLSNTFPKDAKNLIKDLCDRRFGIGADGLILVNSHRTYPFEMIYFNSDGRESTMCGNGGRCIAHYCLNNEIIQNESKFIACDGIHHAIVNDDYVKISMKDVKGYKILESGLFIDTGSPHIVKINEDLLDLDLLSISREIQKSKQFESNGVNVNFLCVIDQKSIQLRTYERGVELETYSCGTGAVAAALSLRILSKSNEEKVIVKTKGGELIVEFGNDDDYFYDIYLSGKVKNIFSGEYIYEKS